jgi:hypothetical protein
MKNRSDISKPVLICISSAYTIRKKTTIAPIFQKGNSADLFPYLTTFQLYLSLVRKIMFLIILHTLNLCQHGSTGPKSTITNLVTYLDFVIVIVLSVK